MVMMLMMMAMIFFLLNFWSYLAVGFAWCYNGRVACVLLIKVTYEKGHWGIGLYMYMYMYTNLFVHLYVLYFGNPKRKINIIVVNMKIYFIYT